MLKFFIAYLLSMWAIFAWALPSISSDSYVTNYGTTPVSTTPVTIVSSVSHPVREVHIFDSSGVPMVAVVTSGPYVTTLDIPPGGDNYALKLSQGDSVTLAAASTTASTGTNIITLLY